MRRIGTVLFVYFMLCAELLAHGAKPENLQRLRWAWEFEPGTVLPISALGILYAAGSRRLRKAMPSAGIKRWQALAFWTGYFALCFALISPLHPWGRALFSAHMAQHEILMLVAAPLLVLGRTTIVCLKALPASWTKVMVGFSRRSPVSFLSEYARDPFVAWLIHGLVLWVWHLPALFQATIDNDIVHGLQHSSFFLSAILFWWAVVDGREKRLGYGMGVLYMFTTALHSGVLGALLTFAGRAWYPVYNQTTFSWGLTPLEDQQLGGLIMWIPAGVIYIIAGLGLFAAWLRESEARVRRNEGEWRVGVKV